MIAFTHYSCMFQQFSFFSTAAQPAASHCGIQPAGIAELAEGQPPFSRQPYFRRITAFATPRYIFSRAGIGDIYIVSQLSIAIAGCRQMIAFTPPAITPNRFIVGIYCFICMQPCIE